MVVELGTDQASDHSSRLRFTIYRSPSGYFYGNLGTLSNPVVWRQVFEAKKQYFSYPHQVVSVAEPNQTTNMALNV